MKSQLTDAERLELAAKLDKDLDDFIDSLPRRERQESAPFESWEEELTSHPFFMKDVPQAGDKLHPLYEGLQKLKYDPEENEPEELAIAYKEDGNFNFKHKNYRMAVISYTEGIRIKCGNAEIEASLYNNRSAAHYFLKNHRSSLADAEIALKFKPRHAKALMRAANCCLYTEKYDKCLQYCDQLLDINKEDVDAINLRKTCVQKEKVTERNRRKKEIERSKVINKQKKLLDEILKRNIRLKCDLENFSLSQLEPKFPQLVNSCVSLNGDGELVWPVVLFYPEYRIMDYIQEFDENDRFSDQLAQVFAEYPEWDTHKKYTLGNLNVYFENERKENIKIDVNQTLLEVLKSDGHVVTDGTPKFIVLVAMSDAEKLFLSQ